MMSKSFVGSGRAVPLSQESMHELCKGLCVFLANTHSLYVKTQNFHWNVSGPMFYTLHQLFETQYTDLQLAIDATAERIRALQGHAPGSYSEFSRLSSITESVGPVSAKDMILELHQDNQAVGLVAKSLLATAQTQGDDVTADFLIERMSKHDQNAWMLRSLAE